MNCTKRKKVLHTLNKIVSLLEKQFFCPKWPLFYAARPCLTSYSGTLCLALLHYLYFKGQGIKNPHKIKSRGKTALRLIHPTKDQCSLLDCNLNQELITKEKEKSLRGEEEASSSIISIHTEHKEYKL